MTPDEMMERRRQLLRDQTPMFSMPNIMNMFGGNQSVPQTMDIRPEVLDMMKRQQNAKPPPGMFFGFGPRFSTEAYNQANNIPTGQIIPPSNTQNEMQKAMADSDLVFHCAATAHEGLSVFSPSFITKNNYEASVSTFTAAINCGVKRVVFCSWVYNTRF